MCICRARGRSGKTPADSPVLKDRNETPEQHDARMAWWREAKFGMFIHWSLFSQLGGEWKGKMSGERLCGMDHVQREDIPSQTTRQWPRISIRSSMTPRSG